MISSLGILISSYSLHGLRQLHRRAGNQIPSVIFITFPIFRRFNRRELFSNQDELHSLKDAFVMFFDMKTSNSRFTAGLYANRNRVELQTKKKTRRAASFSAPVVTEMQPGYPTANPGRYFARVSLLDARYRFQVKRQ